MTARDTDVEVRSVPDVPAPTPRPLRPVLRLVLAAGVALLVVAGLVGRLGLVGGDAVGAADNADGARLFCVVGLTPDATDGRAGGHGVVVTEFRTGGPPCRVPAPVTSGGVVLEATVALAARLDRSAPAPDGSTRVSLEWLAGVYAVLFGLGAGVAAAAALAGSRRRGPAAALVVLPPLLPLLVVPWWTRFLVSTYGEPAGLLGTAWVAWGLLAVAVTRPDDRAARGTALGLLAAGAVVVATAKPGFLPVGMAAVVACAVVTVGVRRAWRRLPGLVAAVVVVALAASPVLAGIRYQDELYASPNTHDLIFTAILPEAGPGALPAVGLPPEAWRHSGEHFYLDLGRGVPGWETTIGARPVETRALARAWLAEHPVVLARMVHRGLVATLRPQIPYLVSVTAGPRTVSGTLPVPEFPEAAQRMGVTFRYLDGLPGRWVPPAVVGTALLAAAATVLVPRPARRRSPAPGLLRVAGALAAAALGTVLLAVVGDGYVELAKHVWLASYLLVVTATVLVASVLAHLTRQAKAPA
ncbi:hypothetical protein [Actinomycetospora atypica]|uniref:Glycosyltransferase RgtA/B/C/D-like domain-containing protein n=1 Tax=Actinomycetospora atypica TaxID=1290095 RepID=A0ABV9YDW5_9PSEU